MSVDAMRSLVTRKGENFVYKTFSEGSRDDYGDVAYTVDASPPTIRGIRSDRAHEVVFTQTGEERKVDISVLVASPLLDSAGSAVTLQDDMTDRAATLTDAGGRIYKMVGLGHEASTPVGASRILCVRQAT